LIRHRGKRKRKEEEAHTEAQRHRGKRRGEVGGLFLHTPRDLHCTILLTKAAGITILKA